MNKYLLVAASLALCSCSEVKLLDQKKFSGTMNGKELMLFTIKNGNECIAQFSNYGGRWLSFWTPDKQGEFKDVVLGFDNLKDYQNAREPYHGAITGRVCGRINQGRFPLNIDTLQLVHNDLFGSPLKNHLHGGVEGFHKQVWEGKKGVDETGDEYVEFFYLSKDGEEGYPGNLKVTTRYTLKKDNTLRIDYRGITDKNTIVNLTNHSFFNLSGVPSQSVLSHTIQINADNYIECDKELVPTGVIKSVSGTPIDFRKALPIGQSIAIEHPEIIKDKGYAIAYVINKKENTDNNELSFVAKIKEPQSGRTVSVYSNQPSLQFYNAWLMDGTDIGKNGIPYNTSAGVAVETQGYPDAPNHSNFPSIELSEGDTYHHVVEYKFSIE